MFEELKELELLEIDGGACRSCVGCRLGGGDRCFWSPQSLNKKQD